MYAKYNAVLRSKSKIPFLVNNAKDLTKGNDYVTTIHAINSCVLKLSKLTKAGNVWRGIKDAKLPPEFWVPNELGVRGGIEYGFSSTTTDKQQAIFYANTGAKAGDAMTICKRTRTEPNAKTARRRSVCMPLGAACASL